MRHVRPVQALGILGLVLAVAGTATGAERAKGRAGRQGPAARAAAETALSRVVVVRDRDGQGGGSGFVVRVFDRVWVASNAHVLAGSDRVEIVAADGTVLPWQRALIGRREDVVLFETETTLEPLSLVESVERSVPIGAAVTAYGNSHAKNAITALPGEVLGIGPGRVEVSATFVRGNSGGPIVLEGTDRVVGISTYFTYPPEGEPGVEGTRFEGRIRRFAVRLDGLTRDDLQEVDPKALRGEVRQLLEAEKRNGLAKQLIADLHERLKPAEASASYAAYGADGGPKANVLAVAVADYPDGKLRDLARLWNRTVEARPDRLGKSRFRSDIEYRLRQFRAYFEEPFKGGPERRFVHEWLRDVRYPEERALSGAILDVFDEVSKRIMAVVDRPEPEVPETPRMPRLR